MIGEQLDVVKGILIISIGIILIGAIIMMINHVLWIKYMATIVIFVLMIVKRKWIVSNIKMIIQK